MKKCTKVLEGKCARVFGVLGVPKVLRGSALKYLEYLECLKYLGGIKNY